VKDPNAPPVRDEVIFMSEIGFDTEGDSVPPYVMNGLGLPGGEQALEQVFLDQGIDGVAAQFNKTVPVISAKVGEEMHVHVINIATSSTFHAQRKAHLSGNASGKPVGGQRAAAGARPGGHAEIHVHKTGALVISLSRRRPRRRRYDRFVQYRGRRADGAVTAAGSGGAGPSAGRAAPLL
jgi:hypothetical protein